MGTKAAKDEHAILVRMPKALHEELKQIAKREHRPVSRQVVHMLGKQVEEEAA